MNDERANETISEYLQTLRDLREQARVLTEQDLQDVTPEEIEVMEREWKDLLDEQGRILHIVEGIERERAVQED